MRCQAITWSSGDLLFIRHRRLWYDRLSTWKRYPHYWSFVWGIQLWQVDSPYKGPVMHSFFMLASLSHWWSSWFTWWRHQMEAFSALLALCAGEFTVPGEFPAQRPVTWSFDVFFDLRVNKRLSKQPRGWWLETPSWSLWRHRNDIRRHDAHATSLELRKLSATSCKRNFRMHFFYIVSNCWQTTNVKIPIYHVCIQERWNTETHV